MYRDVVRDAIRDPPEAVPFVSVEQARDPPPHARFVDEPEQRQEEHGEDERDPERDTPTSATLPDILPTPSTMSPACSRTVSSVSPPPLMTLSRVARARISDDLGQVVTRTRPGCR
jgi:hypothetical protein